MTNRDDPDPPVPLDEVHTPELEDWRTDGHYRTGGGWVNWVDPEETYRVGIERVELPVVETHRVVTAFEVTLWDVEGRPHEACIRETIRNSRLAVYMAEFVATHADAFADQWGEGLAPRPKDVDPTV